MGTLGGFIGGFLLGRSGTPMTAGSRGYFTPKTYKSLEILAASPMKYADWVNALGQPYEKNFKPQSSVGWAMFTVSARSTDSMWMIEFDRSLDFVGISGDGSLWEFAQLHGDLEHPIWERMNDIAVDLSSGNLSNDAATSPLGEQFSAGDVRSRCPKCKMLQVVKGGATDFWCSSCGTHARLKQSGK